METWPCGHEKGRGATVCWVAGCGYDPSSPVIDADEEHHRSVIIAQVLASVAEGDDLEKVCRRPGIPDAETVIKWIMADSVLTSEFIRARALGGHWRPNAAERIEYGLPPEPVRHEKPTTWRMILAVLFVIVCLPLAIVGAQGHKGGPVVGIGVTVLGVIIIFRWISKR